MYDLTAKKRRPNDFLVHGPHFSPVHVRCRYLAQYVLCCSLISLVVPGTIDDVFIWDYEERQRAKGHFKDYTVGMTCIVLLIALNFLERGGVDRRFVAKVVPLLKGPFWTW